MIPLLEGLNPVQRQVVEATEGPVLVLAGAGSGKTRCVIARAGYLMYEKRIPPWNLLIVTFTNKAARELRDRLEALSPGCSSKLWVGTFHSLCGRILRYESQRLPFTSSFSIYDADDQKALLRKVYKRLNIDPEIVSPYTSANIISRCKSNLLQPDRFFEFYRCDPANTTLQKVYQGYCQALLENNALDFDDILLFTAILFDQNPDIRAKYAAQFRYVMIDEYQDTNYAQFNIIRLIAGEHRNLCVVGDDDQAIYSWRGATLKNILNFEEDYAPVRTFRLEQNYRSSQPILSLANSLIARNRDRHDKNLWSDRKQGPLPRLTPYDNEPDEAAGVADEILQRHRQGSKWSDIAVLFRTNAQSRSFETTFMNLSIPYVIVGGVGFYQRREIKDVIGYLRVLANPTDNESLLRIINTPLRKIGDTTIDRLLDYALTHHTSLWGAVENADRIEALREAARKPLRLFAALITAWRECALGEPVALLVERIIGELDLIAYFRATEDLQDETRAENLEEFIDAVGEFSEQFEEVNDRAAVLADYLPSLSLQTDLDQSAADRDVVLLMTMHNAKGLEFENVFVTGLNEKICPHRLCIEPRETLEEERRLLYVAMTRAKTGLSMSYTRWRREYGNLEYANPEPVPKRDGPRVAGSSGNGFPHASRVVVPAGYPRTPPQTSPRGRARIGEVL
jgi:DNA helicase II / ATP-dependent DNA helicase PcrA